MATTADRGKTAAPADEAWTLLRTLFGLQRRRFLIAASELDLHPAQAGALMQLATPLPMSELASLLACDNSNVTGLIDRLEARDLVTRQPSPHDRRVKHLVLTDAGRELRARMLAIGCGYPDGNDFDRLRFDPAFKLACGRLPDTGGDLCSQPTISRWENAPTLREIIRLTYALVDFWCRSYQKPPRSVVLDVDDTVDVPL